MSQAFFNQDVYKVPQNMETFKLENGDSLNTVIIPEGSKLKTINTAGKATLKRIQLADKVISVSENELICSFFIKDNCFELCYMDENNECRFKLIDKRSFETLKEGRIFLHDMMSEYGDKNHVYQYKSIWDIDLSLIDDDMNIYIGNKGEDECFSDQKNETLNGKIYNKNEIVEIKGILDKIVSKVNVPPEGVKNREKIIYAQLVQNLHKYLVYDYETYEIIENQKAEGISYWNLDKETREQIDKTQNLKGLLEDKTVCAGFATIVEELCGYFGIDCKRIENGEHGWNYVKLDGEYYEDDFTWYRDALSVSNFNEINTFLKGKNSEGKRTMSTLEYHQLEDKDMELSKDISIDEMFNLLATDWSKVNNWDEVDISKPIFTTLIENFGSQIETMAVSKKTIYLVALKKAKNECIKGVNSFVKKVRNFILGDPER